MKRWCVKHKTLAEILFSVPICTIFTLLFFLEHYPIWFIIIFDLIMIFGACGFVMTCSSKLIYSAVARLNNECDPYLLLEETEFQLTYSRHNVQEHILQIDNACALTCIGNHEKAKEILCKLNIDKYVGTNNTTKLVYYSNLASVYIHTKEFEKAEIYLEKAKLLASDINKKDKENADVSLTVNTAGLHIAKKDYIIGLNLLNTIKPKNKYLSVVMAYLCAEAHIGLNEIDKARIDLDYVIRNGNKLFIVTEANKTMKNLS